MHDAPSQAIAFIPGDEEQHLVVPPFAVLDACRGCRSVNYDVTEPFCENCRSNLAELGGFRVPVEPISLYAKPSRLRDWLTFYKSEDERLADPQAISAVGHIFGRFFDENIDWVQALAPDYVVVVPSTRRLPPHPLQEIVDRRAGGLSARAVVRRTDSDFAMRKASTDAYVASEPVRGDRVLLLDDVYTTGGRAQSAAHALQLAGAEVTSLVVLGRRINPDYLPRAAELYEGQKAKFFEWSVNRRHSLEHR